MCRNQPNGTRQTPISDPALPRKLLAGYEMKRGALGAPSLAAVLSRPSDSADAIDLPQYRANRKTWTEGDLRELYGTYRELLTRNYRYVLEHNEDDSTVEAHFIPGEPFVVDPTHVIY